MSLEVHIEKKLNGFTLRSDLTAGNTATAILGASGCGKSMTLRCIAGIVKPDKGRILLDGRVLFDSEQRIDLPPQQRGVGLLFQNYALFPNMTVEQNILCGLNAEKDRAARKARCAEMLRAMRLEELAGRRPAELSGGQQQRTALARILVGRPRLLMLDEPFSALDSYLREEVEGEVGSLLAGFEGTALLVTHNRDEAYRLCRDMIVMDSGRVLRTGTTKAVFADLHRRGHPRPRLRPLRPGRRERPAGGAALRQREPLRLEPHLPAAGRLPPVVEGLQNDPVGGRACRPGLPRRTAREHHASDGRACVVRTKTEMSQCILHRLISVFL